MPRSLRISLIVLAVPIALMAWVSVVFAMDRASNDGEILGKVTVEGVEIGGLAESEARAMLTDIEAALAAEPIEVVIDGKPFTLLPRDVGYDIDEQRILDQALQQGRQGGFFDNMRWWLRHFGAGTETLTFQPTYSRTALLTLLRSWEPQAIDDPPTDGAVLVVGGVVDPVYPEPGTGLDIEATADLIEEQILGESRGTVEAVTQYLVPVVTAEQVDAAVARALDLISAPVTLGRILPETSVTFPPEVLAQALASRQVGTADAPDIELFFQLGPLARFLDPIRADVETDPIDAQVVIRPDDVPLVLPGFSAILIDDGELPEAVLAAAESVTRTGPLPFREGRSPDFTTEDAEALGIRDLLYTATTFYPCCGDQKNLNRINNIHRIADEVDGAIVMPGEVFSLNDHVGQRTEEDGYRRAGAIIGPVVVCCDDPANIGGGVSQFTTTLFNAVYWSGLEDVDHTPHTLSFSRYPVVREATLGFPSPDLKFRNNTENAIYIKTEYTNSSITVKMFGDNGGIKVEGITSDKYDFEEATEYFMPNPEVMPGEQEITDDGQPGFTADDTRIITYPDGTTETQVWTWHYDPHSIIVEVHPCELPEDHPDYDPTIECPVQVPLLGGMTLTQATSALNDLGLFIAVGDPFTVTDPLLVGTVRAQDIAPGTWLEKGETVTVQLGQLAEPPPP